MGGGGTKVWKTSIELSLGVSVSNIKSPDGWYWLVLVANYNPPGNYEGQFRENVMPA